MGPNNGFAISPSDSAQLPFLAKVVWVGGAGSLAMVLLGGDTITLLAVPAGTLLTMNVTQVLLTGTSATGLVGLY